MLTNRIGKTFLVICTLLYSFSAIVQPPAGTPPSNPPAGVVGQPCWDQECVPIDSGVIFLLIAGSLLAVRIIYQFQRKKKKR